jgi:hypothetical protein
MTLRSGWAFAFLVVGVAFCFTTCVISNDWVVLEKQRIEATRQKAPKP